MTSTMTSTMTSDLEFAKGRVAVITGAASGIGRAAAEYCAKRGLPPEK